MKRYQEGSFQQFWRREHLITNNIPREVIPKLYLAEHIPFTEAQQKFSVAESAGSFDPTADNFCSLNQYVKCPLDRAFQYCSNVFSLEEWSFGTREIQEFRGGLYAGKEISANSTTIYLRCEAYCEARVVDLLCAWDQGDELWMRHYFRFVDARPSLNKVGTLIMSLSCLHPYYNRSTENLPNWIQSSQSRPDRQWIGDSWNSFCTRQKVDMHNIKTILEARFGHL